MSGEPPLMPALVCQRCGATNPPHAVKCWLCERRGQPNPYAVPTLMPASPADGSSTPARSRVQFVFLCLLIGCIALAVFIGVGIAVQDAGMLVPYLVVITPAFLATGVRAALAVGRNQQPKASTLFFTFLWSGLFTAMALSLIVVASIIALFLWCFQMMTSSSFH